MEGLYKKHYKNKTLYEILGVESSVSDSDLKKAYKLQALKHHPDKNKNKTLATELFQLVSFAYKILTNSDARECYDADPKSIPFENDGVDESSDSTWYDYWQSVFPKISVADIEAFHKKYQNSEEEKQDLYKAYGDCKGDMNKILELMMFSENQCDEDRLTSLLREALAANQLQEFPKFKTTTSSKAKSSRAKKRVAENEEAKLFAKIQTKSSTLSTKRAVEFDDMVSSLEKKYTKKKKKKQESEPDEAAFLAAQQRLKN